MKKFAVAFPMAILLMAVGLFLVFLAIGWISVENIEQILISIQEQIILTIIVGILLLGGGGYLIYLLARGIHYGLTISFQNPEGEVKVSLGAIEEFLKRLGGEFDEAWEMKPKLLMTKEGLEINAQIMLEPTNIPEATTRIQRIIREYVEGVLGIKNIASIKVFISKIAHEREGSEITPLIR